MSGGCKDTGGIFWRTQGSAPAASDTRSCRRLGLRCCCASALEGEVPRRCAAGGRKGLSPLGLAGAKACVLSCCHKKTQGVGMGPGSRVPRRRARREAERNSAGRGARGVPAPRPPGRPRHAAMFTVNVSSSMSYRGRPPLSPARQQRGHGSKCEQRYGVGTRHGTGRGAAHSREGRAGLGVLHVCLSVCLSPAALAPYKVTARAA